MKIISAISAFILVHLIVAYLMWMGDIAFVRGNALFGAALVALYIGCIAAWIATMLVKDKP
jgi:hypothetical protein